MGLELELAKEEGLLKESSETAARYVCAVVQHAGSG